MPTKKDILRQKRDAQLKQIVLKLRFDNQPPDLRSPQYFTLRQLASVVSRSVYWIKKTIDESLPASQQKDSRIRDWGSLAEPYER